MTNLKAPLWRHVTVLEKQSGGGNVKWKCNFCGHIAISSYSRVQAHLLKLSGNQTAACIKVTIEILTELRSVISAVLRGYIKINQHLSMFYIKVLTSKKITCCPVCKGTLRTITRRTPMPLFSVVAVSKPLQQQETTNRYLRPKNVAQNRPKNVAQKQRGEKICYHHI